MEIVPGKTKRESVFEFLRSKVGLQKCDLGVQREYGHVPVIICDTYLTFSFSNAGIVESIGFMPSESVSVANVIDKYGNPDSIDITPYEDDLGNTVSVYMGFYYHRINTAVGFLDQQGAVYNVAESTQVNVIVYYESSAYKKRLEELDLDLWHGYGEYQISR